MENYANPTVLNGTAGNSAPVGGKRRKLKLVTKKAARKALKKLGMKLRGGAQAAPVVADAATGLPVTKGGADAQPAVMEAAGGRRRHGGRKTKRRSASRRASIFGL
jgi:hypothetical protein